MAIIKKFRIKSFKTNKPLVSFDKISLSYDKRQILDNVSFNLNSGQSTYSMILVAGEFSDSSLVYNTQGSLNKCPP